MVGLAVGSATRFLVGADCKQGVDLSRIGDVCEDAREVPVMEVGYFISGTHEKAWSARHTQIVFDIPWGQASAPSLYFLAASQ